MVSWSTQTFPVTYIICPIFLAAFLTGSSKFKECGGYNYRLCQEGRSLPVLTLWANIFAAGFNYNFLYNFTLHSLTLCNMYIYAQQGERG